MTRRQFLRYSALTILGGGFAAAAAGCALRRVSSQVDRSSDQPWRCEHCGYLTRSDQDLSGTRCPRCRRRNVLKRITESELLRYRAS
jgi:DNA-directed RNA polymerase subunit RPC12/RpoP